MSSMTQTLTTKVLIIGIDGYVAGIRCGQLGLGTSPSLPLIPATAGTQYFG